jgi:hypothetical protein
MTAPAAETSIKPPNVGAAPTGRFGKTRGKNAVEKASNISVGKMRSDAAAGRASAGTPIQRISKRETMSATTALTA